MRVVVYGGRNFDDRRAAYAILDRLHLRTPFSVVIHGDYRGADWLARDWARARGVPDEPYPAEWKLLRKAAGPIRNARMVTEGRPDFGVEFPGGDGTADMRAKLAQAGIPYCHVVVHRDFAEFVEAKRREKVWLEEVDDGIAADG
jgi:hypothetical protein